MGGWSARLGVIMAVKDESKLVLKEIKGDLFSCPASTSLAHCVSEDLRMGKGIATLFKTKFGRVSELKAQGNELPGYSVAFP